MAKIELEIAYEKDPGGGWRVVDRARHGDNRFRNPNARAHDTIRWRAPNDHDVCIVVLGESAFSRNGERVIHEIIDVKECSWSDTFEIADVEDGTYEYGVLVKESDGDYSYVRGEHSPPGVVVGGP